MTEETEHIKEAEINPFVRVVKFFYPKTQKPVNFGYLIFGVLTLLMNGLVIHSYAAYVFDQSFTLDYVLVRFWIIGIISFLGAFLYLLLMRIGWGVMAFCGVYSFIMLTMKVLSDLYNSETIEFGSVFLVLTVRLLVIAYLYLGRPVKVLNIDKRLMILPVIMAVLVYSIENVVLFLTMEP